jgi:hypothetical protein
LPELRTRPSSRPRAGKNGSHGGALPLPPQRLPRPLQASRTSQACDRALRLASCSHRANSGGLPLRESTCPSAGRRTIFRRRREACFEFPALASEPRLAQVAGGACAARLRWVAPKRVRSAVQARSDRHSARSVAATEPDRWRREQSGPVATSRPLAVPGFSFVPRCPSLSLSQDPTARARRPVIQTNPLRISTRGPAERIRRAPFARTRRVDGADNAATFERRVTIFALAAQAPQHDGPRDAVASAASRRERWANGHRCPITEGIGDNLRASRCGRPAQPEALSAGSRANPPRQLPLGRRASHARGRWFEPSRAHCSNRH